MLLVVRSTISVGCLWQLTVSFRLDFVEAKRQICLTAEAIFSRARPTLNLPRISPQNSVTCNGEYRRPFIKAQPSFHDFDGGYIASNILTNGAIFSTLKHIDPHTVCGRSTQKDGVCNEHIFRNGSFRELKIAKNQMIIFSDGLTRIIPEIKWVLSGRKCGQNVTTDDRRTFTDKDKVCRLQTLGNDNKDVTLDCESSFHQSEDKRKLN